jgi:hypothetical protein
MMDGEPVREADAFYEDDEPVEKIRAAFERGTKGTTGPPPERAEMGVIAMYHGPSQVTFEGTRPVSDGTAIPESALVTIIR